MASFTLHPLGALSLDLTVWVRRRLPINRMDSGTDRTYGRVLPRCIAGRIEVTQVAASHPNCW